MIVDRTGFRSVLSKLIARWMDVGWMEMSLDAYLEKHLAGSGVFIPDCGPGFTFDYDERTARIIETYLQSVRPPNIAQKS